MPTDGVNLDVARAHLLAVAQDMRAIGLDYYAEHLEYVLREMLGGEVNRQQGMLSSPCKPPLDRETGR